MKNNDFFRFLKTAKPFSRGMDRKRTHRFTQNEKKGAYFAFLQAVTET